MQHENCEEAHFHYERCKTTTASCTFTHTEKILFDIINVLKINGNYTDFNRFII